MRWLKNPMANAAYVALITAIYAAIFIVSSEFVMSYENLLSDSGWASFIISQNMKFVGIGMIGVAVIVDTLSALRRKRYDEYQIVLLEKVFLFNGFFTAVLFPLSLVVLILAPMYFVETIFAYLFLIVFRTFFGAFSVKSRNQHTPFTSQQDNRCSNSECHNHPHNPNKPHSQNSFQT